MLDVTPDWSMMRTAAGAEAEFVGFKWGGPGWYILPADAAGNCQTLLAIPADDKVAWPSAGRKTDPWRRDWPPKQLFLFLSYGSPPFDSFNAAVNAPMRRDER